jgi:hypothetical protein
MATPQLDADSLQQAFEGGRATSLSRSVDRARTGDSQATPRTETQQDCASNHRRTGCGTDAQRNRQRSAECADGPAADNAAAGSQCCADAQVGTTRPA